MATESQRSTHTPDQRPPTWGPGPVSSPGTDGGPSTLPSHPPFGLVARPITSAASSASQPHPMFRVSLGDEARRSISTQSAGQGGIKPCAQVVIKNEPQAGSNRPAVQQLHRNVDELKRCAESWHGTPLCCVLWAAVKEQSRASAALSFPSHPQDDDKGVYIRTVIQPPVPDEQQTNLMNTANFPAQRLRKRGLPAWSDWTGDGADTILLYSSRSPNIQPNEPCIGRASIYAGPCSNPTTWEHELRGKDVEEHADPGNIDGLVAFAKSAMHRCNHHHSRCEGGKPTPLPPRLLDVLGSNPRVIETSLGDEGRYAALSYSWGDSSGAHGSSGTKGGMLKLTSKTRRAFLKEIELSKLSKSHREAILVAKEMGYSHIWIDALCIVQDSDEDWAKQAMLIPEIYGGADLTILAGRSDNHNKGFLQPTHKTPADCSVEVPYQSASNPGLKTCRVGLPRSREIGPTSTRGWCYQELRMARRVLILGEGQVSMKCRERIDYEDGHFEFIGASDDWFDLSYLGRDDVIDQFWDDIAEVMASPGTPIHEGVKPDVFIRRILDSWYRIVSEYSSHSFFDPRDNHAALSGLVRHYQKALARRFGPSSGRYMAGLWEDDMIGGLLWRSARIVDPSLPALQHPKQPTGSKGKKQVPRAPSWSWMSPQGHVHFKTADGRGRSGVQPKWRLPVLEPAKEDGAWGPDPDGWGLDMIQPSRFPKEFPLEVRGYLRQVRISEFKTAEYPKVEPWHPGYKASLSATHLHTVLLEAAEETPLKKKHKDQKLDDNASCGISAIGLFDFDDQKGQAPGSLVWGLAVTSNEGLLLERVRGGSATGTNPGVFKRLGVYIVDNNRLFYPSEAVPMGLDVMQRDKLPMQNVTIV